MAKDDKSTIMMVENACGGGQFNGRGRECETDRSSCYLRNHIRLPHLYNEGNDRVY